MKTLIEYNLELFYADYMKTFKIRVRIAGGRIADIQIQAPDSHAALNMARSQYGNNNVLGAPVEVR